MYKNTASQKWIVFAFEDEGGTNPGEPVTGDAANITANLRLDGGAANAVDDTNPAELEDGYYAFDITAAECNADNIVICPASSTANVNVVGVPGAVYTRTDVSGIEAKIDTIDGIVDDILVDTGTTIDTKLDSILVDTGTTLDTKLDDIQGATFDPATDSLEALRNRGDSAWTGSAITSDSGTAQAGSTSTITLQSGASASNDIYNGQLVYISSGTGVGQSRAISDYVGSTKVATVITDWSVSPDATSVYEIYPNEITEIVAAPTAGAVADAVWDESTTGHTSPGTFGEQCKNDIDAILVDTGTTLDGKINTLDTNVDAILVDTGTTLPATLASQASVDTIDSNVDAILVDTATLGTPAGADLAADIAAIKVDTAATLVDTAEIGAAGAGLTALASATNLATVDTVVDGIKTKTDQLVFTKSNELDTNVQSINGATLTGDGSATPFDVA